ncbi:MAG TPA: acetamidase/formamidase family protein [Gammaproteobacteria bacterium]|nr:acetamidase/formamidase family protein [Gammaproteobacteria bacterium]
MNLQQLLTLFVLLALAFGAASARGDTTDVKGPAPVVVKKQGAHCQDDNNCFNRLHPAIPMVARAKPGEHIVYETRDALDSDFDFESIPADVTAADLNLVHPMTGPVHIEGAKRGDVLAVTLVDIAPDDYGYTVIVPGFGFLRDKFTEPYIANWRLTRLEATSEQIPGVAIPFRGFMGSVGVLPGEAELDMILEREARLAEAGGIVLTPQPLGAQPAAVCGPGGSHKDKCLRTIPPRENGGNMDVKQMQVGTTLLLPCFVDGCGLFIGDVHYAQGDGEVSGTAIEMGAVVTVETQIRKGLGAQVKVPHFEGGDQLKRLAPSEFYATTGVPLKEAGEIPPFITYIDGEKIGPLTNLSEDLALAARNALIEMIDWMVENKGLTREQAYVVSSVAVDLRIGQLVDVPNYIVSAILPLTIFTE